MWWARRKFDLFFNLDKLEENSYWHKRVEVFIEYILSLFRKNIEKSVLVEENINIELFLCFSIYHLISILKDAYNMCSNSLCLCFIISLRIGWLKNMIFIQWYLEFSVYGINFVSIHLYVYFWMVIGTLEMVHQWKLDFFVIYEN